MKSDKLFAPVVSGMSGIVDLTFTLQWSMGSEISISDIPIIKRMHFSGGFSRFNGGEHGNGTNVQSSKLRKI